MNILWLSLTPVKNKYSSTSFSLAKELSKTNKVFFIDNPVTLGTVFKNVVLGRIGNSGLCIFGNRYRKVPDLPADFISVTPRNTFSINWISNKWLYEKLCAWNNRIFMSSISHLIKDFGIEDFLFVSVFDPFYGRSFAAGVKPKLKVYYSVDDIRHSPFVRKHGPYLERQIISNYDLTLVTSRQLFKLHRKYARAIAYLPNAADTLLFRRAWENHYRRPAEMPAFKGKYVVYTGHIDWRTDIDLVREVALSLPAYRFVLVGPLSLKPDEVSSLNLPNIIMTGGKALAELPAFLQYADCAIIPFRCNDLTKSIYPLKINEYLSAGVPVVATPFSEDIRQFGDVIELRSDSVEFAIGIRDCIDLNNEAAALKRVERADENNWEARAANLMMLVHQHLPQQAHQLEDQPTSFRPA